MTAYGPYPILTAADVARTVANGQTVSFSGFTPAGAAKAVPEALADYARGQHASGTPFQIRVLTGASSGHSIDEDLAAAEAISWRCPYHTGKALRRQINRQQVEYVDMHLSHVPQMVAWGFLGEIDLAVVEATDITPDGRVYLSTSIGASPTYLKYAKRVVIELNRHQSPRLSEMADILVMPPPPHRNPIPIYDPLTRVGVPYAQVDPNKVVGVVESDASDQVGGFSEPDDVSRAIGNHVADFLVQEMRNGRVPSHFLPLQAGVGNIANGVMTAIGNSPDIPPFFMYSEVFQDSLVDLMTAVRIRPTGTTCIAI